jgi:hypothetical protein
MESDMERIPILLNGVLFGEDSLLELLRLLTEKGGASEAYRMAVELRTVVERLMKIWHRGIDYVQSADHFVVYTEIRDCIEQFLKEFELGPIDCKVYEGRKDPLATHLSYL